MMRHIAILLLLLIPGASLADTPLPKLNVVLFTPADVTPPPGYERRLTEVADYTEAFFAGWMKRWDYSPKRDRIFERNADGSVRVLLVRGKEKLASGKYDKPTFAAEVWNTAVPKYKLGRHRHVWWVWVYLGTVLL